MTFRTAALALVLTMASLGLASCLQSPGYHIDYHENKSH